MELFWGLNELEHKKTLSEQTYHLTMSREAGKKIQSSRTTTQSFPVTSYPTAA